MWHRSTHGLTSPGVMRAARIQQPPRTRQPRTNYIIIIKVQQGKTRRNAHVAESNSPSVDAPRCVKTSTHTITATTHVSVSQAMSQPQARHDAYTCRKRLCQRATHALLVMPPGVSRAAHAQSQPSYTHQPLTSHIILKVQ